MRYKKLMLILTILTSSTYTMDFIKKWGLQTPPASVQTAQETIKLATPEINEVLKEHTFESPSQSFLEQCIDSLNIKICVLTTAIIGLSATIYYLYQKLRKTENELNQTNETLNTTAHTLKNEIDKKYQEHRALLETQSKLVEAQSKLVKVQDKLEDAELNMLQINGDLFGMKNKVEQLESILNETTNIAFDVLDECVKSDQEVTDESLLNKCTSTLQKLHDTYPLTHTWLHNAAHDGQLKKMQTLLHLGWNIDSQDTSKRTPLLGALFNHKFEIAKVLLDAGADPKIPDINNVTPMHAVADSDNVELIPELLKHGANIDARTNSGRTPLAISMYKDQKDTMEKLIQSGASIIPALKMLLIKKDPRWKILSSKLIEQSKAQKAKCPICLEGIANGSQLTLPQCCFSIYCTECFEQLNQHQYDCACCKQGLTFTRIITIQPT
ncbi:MAG: ankyrin repeat domain-containing protein [Candidatus Dependentiae bacterium]